MTAGDPHGDRASTNGSRMDPTSIPDEDLAGRVAALLDGRMVATAESCTAGRIAEVLASIEKASEFLRGGVVSYQEQVKRDLLGVTAVSVLSAEAAEQMAVGAARVLGADVTVATTGVAGDEPQDGSPPGTVYIGVKVGPSVSSTTHYFDGSPTEVCDQARREALRDLIAAMERAT
jgi:nicotinamide-nucleotide amidase